MDKDTDWKAEFYTDASGKAPVAEFLKTLPPRTRDHIFQHIQLLQERGVLLGMPYVRHLEGKLWELRVRTRGATYRLIYFTFTGRRIILLHAFVKKTKKTPTRELETAKRRLADFLERER